LGVLGGVEISLQLTVLYCFVPYGICPALELSCVSVQVAALHQVAAGQLTR